MRPGLAALAALFALGCAQPPPAPSTPQDRPAAPQSAEAATQADSCGWRAYEHLIGRPVSELDRSALPARARVITPEMAVTLDFRADRLNILVGVDGRIGSLRCF